MGEEVHEGASIQEQLIEACRRNNPELLDEVLKDMTDPEITNVLNSTTTVLGNYLYHEAARYGHYEIIDHLLDQPDFECDPINRTEKDTPLHTVIRWINSEPPAQRPYGNHLVDMMLQAGSDPRIKNKGGLTAYQLVDPANQSLRDLIRRHEYVAQNLGDFANVAQPSSAPPQPKDKSAGKKSGKGQPQDESDYGDDEYEDAEFSGSDEDERAEFERRRAQAKKNKR